MTYGRNGVQIAVADTQGDELVMVQDIVDGIDIGAGLRLAMHALDIGAARLLQGERIDRRRSRAGLIRCPVPPDLGH